MFKFIRNIIIALLCVCIFLGLFFFAGQKLPYQYDRSYYAVLKDKYNYNLQRTEPSIVFVGGSNLAFGLDTEKISQSFDMPAYNFGFHAGLKRDFYLNALKSNILKGDIIVLVFEYSAYIEDLMSEDITWESIDNSYELIKCIPSSNIFNLYRFYPIYLIKKISDSIFDPHPLPNNKAYAYESFNEYGDNVFERYENIRQIQEIKNGAYIEIKESIISDESVAAFSEFREYCESVGAKIYASCPCVDKYAVKEIENNGADFKKTYEDKTGIKMISDPSEYILETSLFYDTDYHLNLNGVKIRTQMLIDDLKKVI